MAQHKSAKKRARQNLERRARNRTIRSRLKTAVKYARVALAGTDGAAASDALRKRRARDPQGRQQGRAVEEAGEPARVAPRARCAKS